MFAQNKETVWGQFIAPGGFDHHELSKTWRKMLEMLRKMTTDSLIFIKILVILSHKWFNQKLTWTFGWTKMTESTQNLEKVKFENAETGLK